MLPSTDRSCTDRCVRPRLAIGVLALLVSGSPLQAQIVPAVTGAPHSGQAASHAPGVSGATAPAYSLKSSANQLASDSAVIPFAIRARPAGVSAAAVDTGADDTTDTTATQPAHHHHILLGMAIGTVAGAGIGYVWVRTVCHDNNSEAPPCEYGERLSAVYGALAGWLVGGIIGAYTERRVPGHPDRRVSMEMIPQRGRGMAVTVRVH